MCGVIGVHLNNVTEEDAKLVNNLFRQSMVRGKHATGVTYLKSEKLNTIKESIPADQFMDKHEIGGWIDQGKLRLIGHIRYSTSDLRYNQPFANEYCGIAHNGVISQQSHHEWEFKTETENDSELILKTLEEGRHPLQFYKDRSMAVTQVTLEGALIAYRNHERPLWYAKRDNGIIFASTQNILERSGIEGAVKTKPFIEYFYRKELKESKMWLTDEFEDLQ